MTLIKLIVGDDSRDGHSMTEDFYLKTNCKLDELLRAYAKGTEIIGKDLTREVQEYEDSYLSNEFIEAASEHFPDGRFDDIEEDGVNSREYVNLYMDICLLGNTGITYKILKPDSKAIGGYGLFVC
jgi:hypothetical protein